MRQLADSFIPGIECSNDLASPLSFFLPLRNVIDNLNPVHAPAKFFEDTLSVVCRTIVDYDPAQWLDHLL